MFYFPSFLALFLFLLNNLFLFLNHTQIFTHHRHRAALFIPFFLIDLLICQMSTTHWNKIKEEKIAQQD